jgi:hypothetical protein
LIQDGSASRYFRYCYAILLLLLLIGKFRFRALSSLIVIFSLSQLTQPACFAAGKSGVADVALTRLTRLFPDAVFRRCPFPYLDSATLSISANQSADATFIQSSFLDLKPLPCDQNASSMDILDWLLCDVVATPDQVLLLDF